MPAASLVWVWLTPTILYSTGSSMYLLMLTSGLLSCVSALKQAGRLPLPSRAGYKNHAVGLMWGVLNGDSVSTPVAVFIKRRGELGVGFIENTHNDFPPSAIGRVLTRRAYCLPDTFIFEATVLRYASFVDFEVGWDFDTTHWCGVNVAQWAIYFFEDTVYAINLHILFAWFYMYVAHPLYCVFK